jgi:hypothetical protein
MSCGAFSAPLPRRSIAFNQVESATTSGTGNEEDPVNWPTRIALVYYSGSRTVDRAKNIPLDPPSKGECHTTLRVVLGNEMGSYSERITSYVTTTIVTLTPPLKGDQGGCSLRGRKIQVHYSRKPGDPLQRVTLWRILIRRTNAAMVRGLSSGNREGERHGNSSQ